MKGENKTRRPRQTRQHAIKDREREIERERERKRDSRLEKCKREWTTSGPSNGTVE
jgi:hypothetical protein